MHQKKFFLIGGFLGAGKTTVIRLCAEWLGKKGLKLAVITNDQAEGLVDSELMMDSGLPTAEIAGGCFCCRSDLLMEKADQIVNEWNPDVLLAEPVGSCTDLMATVCLPIAVIFQRPFDLAPLSVLVDPIRAQRVLKRAEAGETDPNDVDYIYLKQLEEAEVIVINKKELLSEERLLALREALVVRYPTAKIFAVSARKRLGLEEWWEFLLARRQSPSAIMEVDYARYAEGEARMGWMNVSYALAAETPTDFNQLAERIASRVQEDFARLRISVAHFKLRVATTEDEGRPAGAAAVVQWVDSERDPEFTSRASQLQRTGQVLVNVRAESDPELLHRVVHGAISESCAGHRLTQQSIAAFSPAAPNPVHRVSSVPAPYVSA